MTNEITPSGGYLAILNKIASLKDVDLDKLQKLMDMQEAWEARQAKEAFNDAMAAAQGDMTQISKDSVNPQTRSRYASLAALDAAIRPIYSKHGFSVSFDEESASDTHVLVIASVSHGSETRRFKKWVPVTTKGFQGKEMSTLTHASIGGMSYGRRTLLKMIFNLAEDDDDGNAAGGRGGGGLDKDRDFVNNMTNGERGQGYVPPTRVKDQPATDEKGNRI